MGKININKVSVVGLGKLGLPLAACFADRGFSVVGVDLNKRNVNLINTGKSPIIEPHLNELISKNNARLVATTDHSRAIQQTDITFILVATPSDSYGNFSNNFIISAIKSLAESFAKSDKKYHIFVISSTVMPTSIDKIIIPLLEKYSGKKVSADFGVCYVPDFVALGDIIKGFLKPDMVVIGESDKTAGEHIAKVYKKLCVNKPKMERMSIINGEICKISLNNYITLKISFANALANLCEKIPGANSDVVSNTIGIDKRISPYYLKGGLSFGGTCFPRDVKAWSVLAKKYKVHTKLQDAINYINEFQDKHLFNIVIRESIKIKSLKISILGLAFKPNTPVIEKSPAIKLIANLLRKNFTVTVCDPLAMDNVRKIFGEKIKYAATIKDCVNSSPVCVVATSNKEFEKIDNSYLISGQTTTVIDCWRLLPHLKKLKNVNYKPLGIYTE